MQGEDRKTRKGGISQLTNNREGKVSLMVLTFLKREQFQTNQSLLKTGNFWLVFFLVGLQISSRMSDLKISVCRQGRAEQRL